MNCDLDIENKPNKGLKTVQNPSVSIILKKKWLYYRRTEEYMEIEIRILVNLNKLRDIGH